MRFFLLFSASIAFAAPAAKWSHLPLSFELNTGQFTADVHYAARSGAHRLYLDAGETILAVKNQPELRTKLAGASLSAAIVGEDRQAATSNYFIGNDPAKWRTSVPNFGRVRYVGIYPGIDLIYYGQDGTLEYDWTVSPGADPRRIRMVFEGADRLRIDRHGDLVIRSGKHEYRHKKPALYQEIAGKRVHVAGAWKLHGAEASFAVGAYDHRQPLVIDPLLIYSTYLGGTGYEWAYAIAVDSIGSTYVTGGTGSTNFPTAGSLQRGLLGSEDVFVTKINPSGSAKIYSTYLGGSGGGGDEGHGIAVDLQGNAYITGNTGSFDFPTVNPIQAKNSGSDDVFLAKLNATGSALIYSTYLGGSSLDSGSAIALDAAGSAYVVGTTSSSDFPVTNAFQAVKGAQSDAFVAKINPAGSACVYATYLGGNNVDEGNAIAVDAAGNAYVTGYTSSTNFPVASAFRASNAGGPDAFVSKLNPAGSALVYSTYLGGTATDYGTGIAVDASGSAYVTGSTTSGDFPLANPMDDKLGSLAVDDAFVTKLNPAGSALVYSTYLGGGGGDQPYALAIDQAGRVYITGRTNSSDFPLKNPIQNTRAAFDMFVTEIEANGSTLVFSTFLGGSGSESGRGIAIDGLGNIHVAGEGTSTDFPVKNAIQSQNGATTPTQTTQDALILMIGDNPSAALTQTGFTFQTLQGGGAPPSKTYRISNPTGPNQSFTLTPSTLSGGSNWLVVSPLSGTLTAGISAPITVSVDPTKISALAPGDYYAQIQVDIVGAPNGPQFLTIVLNVLGATAALPPVVEPSGLVFIGVLSGANPAAQSVIITNLSTHPSSFTATAATTAVTQRIFTALPAAGTVVPGQPVNVSVTANLAGLATGTYRGTLTLQFPQDGVTRTVDLLLVVSPSLPTTASPFRPESPGPAAGCTPSSLLPTLTLLGANFDIAVGWPTSIQTTVVDNCGNYIDNGSVVATFSNSDPQLSLQNTGAHSGQWAVTWAAQRPGNGVKVTVTAQANGMTGSNSVTGATQSNPNVPLVYTNGTVNAGSYAPTASPSPGELISIFGAQLADGTQSASALPLPANLQSATLRLAGLPLPLVFTSAGQVNAQIPYPLPMGATLSLIAQRGNRLSVPQAVSLSPAEPAIFTTNLVGTGQGHIYVVPGPGVQVLADVNAPAKAGDVLQIYCTGLGPVSPKVTAGSATPTDALYQTASPVTLTIGGVPVTPLFAGLTPGFTGLYQINAIVPAGVTPDSRVPVVITVGGAYQSPTVTMAVK
jgi:uncharacterized protein (TIGR03437 family)